LKGNERKVVDYFNKTKVYNQSWLKYGVLAKKIKLAIDDNSDYKVRKIFNSLLDKKYFNQKKNVKRSYLYQFVNKKLKTIEPEIFRGVTITFD
jgi:hypothetical protein